VVCNDDDIRLVGGPSPVEGRVEVCYDEVWGTICDQSWSITDANVACRQLGFLSVGEYKNIVFFPDLCGGDF